MSGETCDPRLASLWDDDIVIFDEGDPRAYVQNPPRHAGVWPRQDIAKRAIDQALDGARKLYGDKEYNRLAKLLPKIPIVYNGRLKRALMRCCSVYNKRDDSLKVTKIDVATDIDWPDDLAFETLVHEFCHAIRTYESDDYIMEQGHGPEWKRLMRAAGQSPDRYCADPRISEQRNSHFYRFYSDNEIALFDLSRLLTRPKNLDDGGVETNLFPAELKKLVRYLNDRGWLLHQDEKDSEKFTIVPQPGSGHSLAPTRRAPPAPERPAAAPRRKAARRPPPAAPRVKRPIPPVQSEHGASTEELSRRLEELSAKIEKGKGSAAEEQEWDRVIDELQKRGWR